MPHKIFWNLIVLAFLCFPLGAHELVEINKIDPSIYVKIRNPAYPERTKGYLVRQVAKQLSRVQKELEKDCITLVVIDAYRPFSYAKFFERPFAFAPFDECNPVVNGHYRGTAVDVTIAYQDGQPLEMPLFLNMHELDDLAATYQDLSCQAYHNLQKLQKAMAKHRFVPSSTEWWHFDYRDWFQYPSLDIPFEELCENE